MNAQSTIAATMRQFESKSELTEFLRATASPSHMLGNSSNAPREFFCIQVRNANLPVVNIGVLSSGTGIKPSWLFKKDKLLVGFNDRVAVFAPPKGACEGEIGLLSPFWEFIELEQQSHACVVCETAIAAILPSGLLMWRMDLDLITKYERVGNTISLKFDDTPAVQLDLISGKRLA